MNFRRASCLLAVSIVAVAPSFASFINNQVQIGTSTFTTDQTITEGAIAQVGDSTYGANAFANFGNSHVYAISPDGGDAKATSEWFVELHSERGYRTDSARVHSSL